MGLPDVVHRLGNAERLHLLAVVLLSMSSCGPTSWWLHRACRTRCTGWTRPSGGAVCWATRAARRLAQEEQRRTVPTGSATGPATLPGGPPTAAPVPMPPYVAGTAFRVDLLQQRNDQARTRLMRASVLKALQLVGIRVPTCQRPCRRTSPAHCRIDLLQQRYDQARPGQHEHM